MEEPASRLVRFQVVGVDHVRLEPAHEGFRVGAEHLGETRVDLLEAPVRPADREARCSLLEGGPEASFGFREGLVPLVELLDETFVVEAMELGRLGRLARGRRRGGLGNLQQGRIDPREELDRVHRLSDEGPCPERQGETVVLLRRVGGRVENERALPQARVFLPGPAEREAVHDGHQDVGDGEVRRQAPGDLESLFAVASDRDEVPRVPEDELQEAEGVLVVLDHEGSHGQASRASAERKHRTWPSKVAGSSGFSTYPEHPASSARSRSPGIAYDVTATIGTVVQ